jgi:hypothetical protein
MILLFLHTTRQMGDRLWYPLAQEWWFRLGNVTVRDESGQRLLVIPIDFMQGGLVDTYAYIADQVRCAYVEEGDLFDAGRALNLHETVHAGEVRFRRKGGSA